MLHAYFACLENRRPLLADSVEKVDFSGNVTLSLASSKKLFTTVKWLFGTSLTVAALSVGYLRVFA
jgi:hypothetical protein